MNQRLQILAGLIALFVPLASGCQKKDETKPEPAASAAQAAPAVESPAGGTTPSPTGSNEAKPATVADKGSLPPTGSAPTTTITNGERSVKTNGTDLKLKNETGKGGISTSGGSPTITGKNGKSVTLPVK